MSPGKTGETPATRRAAAANACPGHRRRRAVAKDADERLIDGCQALQALRGQDPAFVGAVQFHEHLTDGAGVAATSLLSRVFPGRLRYTGRIHEQVNHSLPVRRLAVRIGHDGYLPDLAVRAGRARSRLVQLLLLLFSNSTCCVT